MNHNPDIIKFARTIDLATALNQRPGDMELYARLEATKAHIFPIVNKMSLSRPLPGEPCVWLSGGVWLSEGKVTAHNFDFSFCDLRHVDFKEVSLKSCVFRGSNLAGANIGDIIESNFHRANLDGATFNVDLHVSIRCDFNLASLRKAKFIAKPHDPARFIYPSDYDPTAGMSFKGADLSNSFFQDVEFPSVDFSEASLAGAHFLRCTFSPAFISQANFTNAHLERTQLRPQGPSGADFSEARIDGLDGGLVFRRGGNVVEGAIFGEGVMCGVGSHSIGTPIVHPGARRV